MIAVTHPKSGYSLRDGDVVLDTTPAQYITKEEDISQALRSHLDRGFEARNVEVSGQIFYLDSGEGGLSADFESADDLEEVIQAFLFKYPNCGLRFRLYA